MFTAKQKSVLGCVIKNDPQIVLLSGAVRSGKTFINNFLFLRHVNKFKGKNVKFIVAGFSISSLKKNVLDDLQNEYGINTSLNKNNEFEMFGNTIVCFGTADADSYKSIRGFTSFGALINEATLCHQNSYDQILKRCSGDGARIYMDTNPSAPNHYIKHNIIDKADENIKVFNFALTDNPFLSTKYIEMLKNNTSGVFYDRDILGLWVSADGMIYKDFDSDNIVTTDKMNTIQIIEYWGGIDFGFEHKGVVAIYGKDVDGNIYRLSESVESGKDMEWWIEIIRMYTEMYKKNILLYCDSARPDNISYIAKNGYRVLKANKNVIPGIQFISGLMKSKKLKIVKETNVNYLSEIYSYVWNSTNKEEPMKINDDSMDSERYALFSHLNGNNKMVWFK